MNYRQATDKKDYDKEILVNYTDVENVWCENSSPFFSKIYVNDSINFYRTKIG